MHCGVLQGTKSSVTKLKGKNDNTGTVSKSIKLLVKALDSAKHQCLSMAYLK